MDVTCPGCGKSFHLTPEYMALYAGMAIDCGCGHSVPVPDDQGGLWRDGPFVVVERGAHMPQRCCVCNVQIERPVKPVTMKWIAPEHRNTGAVIGGLIGASVADAHAEHIVVTIVACPRHARPSMRKLVSFMMILGGGFGAAAFSTEFRAGAETYIAVGSMIAVMVAGFILFSLPPRIRIEEIRSNCAWIRGFGEAYLQSLPDLRAAHEADTAERARTLSQLQD